MTRTAFPTPSIVAAMTDPALFGRWFASDTWAAWRVFLAALFALPLRDEAQIGLYRTHTGRTLLPSAPTREGWVIAGRRAGKSFIAALIAVYLAAFRTDRRRLAPGERGVVMVLAADRRQARVILSY